MFWGPGAAANFGTCAQVLRDCSQTLDWSIWSIWCHLCPPSRSKHFTELLWKGGNMCLCPQRGLQPNLFAQPSLSPKCTSAVMSHDSLPPIVQFRHYLLKTHPAAPLVL